MLNPVTGFEPGMLVDYHGSLTELHGQYQAYPCTCLHCDDPVVGSVRYRLVSADGTVIDCVRPRSISPELEDDDEDDDPHEECLGIHNSADGYRDCDGHLI